MKHGIILFAHGARDPRWVAPFETVLARVRALCPASSVRLAFLELMLPSLPEAAQGLVVEGCTHVSVQPLFLGTGGHLRRDLPLLMDKLQQEHPQVQWSLQAAIGEHEAVIDAMARSVASAGKLPA